MTNIDTIIGKEGRAAYVLEEEKLRQNLALIRSVSERSGAEIILAYKAYALWRTFPIFREYISSSTASSLYEAEMAVQEMGAKAHTFSPAYTKENIRGFIERSSHITLNSLSQYELLQEEILAHPEVSWGLRINPEFSPVETDLYNPCAPGSRFGILSEKLRGGLPEGIEGLHCHVLCEGDAEDLRELLGVIEEKFPKALAEARWLNLGGGHLMTRKDYNVALLIETLKTFREKHPHLSLILEPGSAFAWQTGYLRSHVVDVVENHGTKTAILDVSFTCHMPDTLEMPYQPYVRGAERLVDAESTLGKHQYRLGGNSCLSGDFVGDWLFPEELKVGDEVILEDMLHYTTVKTTMFNGIEHPDIILKVLDGSERVLRRYTYEDYKHRMD